MSFSCAGGPRAGGRGPLFVGKGVPQVNMPWFGLGMSCKQMRDQGEGKKVPRTTVTGIVVLVVAGSIVGYAGRFCYEYKGFIRFMFNQLRSATWAENKNLYFCNRYWLEFMQKLALKEPTGVYGFDRVAEKDDFGAGRIEYHRGHFAQAIPLIERDIRNRGESEHKLFWLAMCYMRNAEVENCLSELTHTPPAKNVALSSHPGSRSDPPAGKMGQMCSLPLGRFHDRADSSRMAAKLFAKLLDKYDKTNELYQWLLNFSYMTIGGFPQNVPPKYLIQSRFINSFYGEEKRRTAEEFRYLSFEDRASELGVDTYGTGRGVAVEDFDKDGYLDIVTGGGFEEVKYFKNDHGLRFIDKTAEVGLAGIKQPFIITAADYDNDGWPDLFVSRPFGRFQLFRNNGNRTFTDVTASSGLLDGIANDEITATWVPAWGDVNNDGYLDLFLAQWGLKLPFVTGLMAKPRMDSRLFMNEHGHFVDKTEEYGLGDIVKDQYFIGAAFGDYNSDGYPDLFLSSPTRNTSALLKNISGHRFEKTNLTRRAEGGFVASFVDVNHDGKLDVFQAGFADARTSTQMAVFGKNLNGYHSGHSTIFLQTADGRFDERNDFFDMPIGTMGSSFGDVNNDGCYDFYLGTGDPEGWFVLPHLMYLGETEGTKCVDRLRNISMLQGFGTIQKGHGIVFFDFDNDGRQDIYSSLGGMWPGDRWPNQFFVNRSKLTNTWVKIRLRGKKTNYFGVGCTIRVTAENADGDPIVRYYNMDNKTGFGSAPYLAHIGLMNAVRIKSIDVYWPVSRRWRTYIAELKKLNMLDEED